MSADAAHDAVAPDAVPPDSRPPRRVRLPGFAADASIGLGDAVARATRAVGIAPCGACTRRAATLNRWIVFTGRGPHTRP